VAATILSGRELAKAMQEEITAAVAEFKGKHGFAPTIAVLRAGEDPASVSYAKAIEKAFTARGMGFALHTLPRPRSWRSWPG